MGPLCCKLRRIRRCGRSREGCSPNQLEVKEVNLRSMIKVDMVNINRDFDLVKPVSITGMSQGFGHCSSCDSMPQESPRVFDTISEACIQDQRADHIGCIHAHLMSIRSYHLLHNDHPEGVIELCIWLDIMLCSFINEYPLMVWNLATIMRLETIHNLCPVLGAC